MYGRLIIEGNAVYEIDDECLKKKQGRNTGIETNPQLGKRREEKPTECKN